jgi:hypothetical protein
MGAGAESTRRSERRLRQEVLDGRSCAKCGFSDVRALVVDHVRGGGNKQRHRTNVSQRLGTWSAVYRHVRDNGWDGYQVLCHNCNFIKRLEDNESAPPAPEASARGGRRSAGQSG